MPIEEILKVAELKEPTDCIKTSPQLNPLSYEGTRRWLMVVDVL